MLLASSRKRRHLVVGPRSGRSLALACVLLFFGIAMLMRTSPFFRDLATAVGLVDPMAMPLTDKDYAATALLLLGGFWVLARALAHRKRRSEPPIS
jgi:hypothetical protein